MPTARPTARWVLGGAAILLAAAAWTWPAAGDARLHDAPLVLVGPSVVTAALVAEADAMDGHPFDAGGTESPERARTALARGDVVAVVEIDLTGTEDALTLSPGHRPDLDRAIELRVRAIEQSHGRTVVVTARDDDGIRARSLARTAYVASLAGFLLALVVSLVWGPFARTLPRALARAVALLCWAVAAGGVALLAIPSVPAAGVVAAGVLAAGALTFACEALAGLPGLLAAALILLVLPLPLAISGDPLLIGQPWAAVSRWTVAGATTQGLLAVTAYDGRDLLLPAVVVLGAIALGLAVLVVCRLAPAPRKLAENGTSAAGPPRQSPPVSVPAAVETAAAAQQARENGGPDGPLGGDSAAHFDPAPLTAAWRAQLVGTALALTAAAVIGAAIVERVRGDPVPRPLTSLASTTRCVATGSVEGVDDLNRIAELRGEAAMQGGDVGASARLQDGRALWLFGDTLRSADFQGSRFVRNSMMLVAPGCLQMVLPESGGAVIPNRTQSVGYWPMSVAVVGRPGYDLVVVTAQRVHTTGPADDVFAFEALGPAVATFVVPAGRVPQLVSVTDIGPDDADTTKPMWGAATVLDDDWLYLYGTSRQPDPQLGTGFALSVARVRAEEIDRPARWRYWNGSDWTADVRNAQQLIPSTDGVSQTLSVFVRDGVWYAFSKRNEVLGQDLVFWTAAGPTGPFTARPPVGSLPSAVADGELRYMPLAHPELPAPAGQVVVSYSNNSTDLGAVLDDPLLYRPRFITVPLPHA